MASYSARPAGVARCSVKDDNRRDSLTPGAGVALGEGEERRGEVDVRASGGGERSGARV